MESGVCGGASEFDIAGTGVLSTRCGWKGRAGSPHHQLARKQSRRQKSAVHEQRQEKAVKRSSTVVALVKCDRFFGSLGPRRLPNMSNTTEDESGETNYLYNNNRKDDSGDDSAGETSYLTNNGKGSDPDDRRPAAGGGVAGSNIGGSSITTSGGGASSPDLGDPATAAAAPVPAWIAVLGNFLGQLISAKLDQALKGRIPAALPQTLQQAGTSEQPPAIQPASTNAQEILPLEPHQHLQPQHCQGGSAAASGGPQHPAQQQQQPQQQHVHHQPQHQHHNQPQGQPSPQQQRPPQQPKPRQQRGTSTGTLPVVTLPPNSLQHPLQPQPVGPPPLPPVGPPPPPSVLFATRRTTIAAPVPLPPTAAELWSHGGPHVDAPRRASRRPLQRATTDRGQGPPQADCAAVARTPRRTYVHFERPFCGAASRRRGGPHAPAGSEPHQSRRQHTHFAVQDRH